MGKNKRPKQNKDTGSAGEAEANHEDTTGQVESVQVEEVKCEDPIIEKDDGNRAT